MYHLQIERCRISENAGFVVIIEKFRYRKYTIKIYLLQSE